MKFDKKNYPILDSIEKIRRGVHVGFSSPLSNYDLKPKDFIQLGVNYLYKTINSTEVDYYAKTINNKILNREFSFMKDLGSFTHSDLIGNGIILFSKEFTLFYEFYIEDKQLCYWILLTAYENEIIYILTGEIYDNGKFSADLPLKFDEYKDTYLKYFNEEVGREDVLMFCLCYQIFKKFAPIEENILESHPKKKTNINGSKYINNSNIKVNIIDSTWFRRTIQNNAFGVKGHFRLQPYGKGKSKRKIIWIKDYQKNSYTQEPKKPELDQSN